MNTPDQLLFDAPESHVIAYIAYLEDALRGLSPDPISRCEDTSYTALNPVFISELTRQTAISRRNC